MSTGRDRQLPSSECLCVCVSTDAHASVSACLIWWQIHCEDVDQPSAGTPPFGDRQLCRAGPSLAWDFTYGRCPRVLPAQMPHINKLQPHLGEHVCAPQRVQMVQRLQQVLVGAQHIRQDRVPLDCEPCRGCNLETLNREGRCGRLLLDLPETLNT